MPASKSQVIEVAMTVVVISGVPVMCMWCACGVHVMHVVCMWYACGVHVVSMWYAEKIICMIHLNTYIKFSQTCNYIRF